MKQNFYVVFTNHNIETHFQKYLKIIKIITKPH